MKKVSKLIIMLMLFILLSVVLTACGSGGGGDDNNNPTVNLSDVTPIVGTWEHTESNCTETLEFHTDKTFKISSHLEIQTGIYELTKKNNTEYTLSINIQNDNGELSCPEFLSGGNAKNDTGLQGSLDVIIIDTQLTITSGISSFTYQKK